MRSIVLLCLLALTPPAPAATDVTPHDFSSGMPLTLAPNQPFHRVELPLAVHAQARPDLADVRVFNSTGEAVPYAFVTGGPPSTTAPPVAVPRFPLQTAESRNVAMSVRIETDGRLIALSRSTQATAATTWLFDLSSLRTPVQSLRLDWATPIGGFSTRVFLTGSNDLQRWTPLADATLLDIPYGGQRLQQKQIGFPPAQYRYLRLAGERELPLLTSADVEPVPVAAVAPERWVDIAAQADEETGDYLFDLGADLVATRLQLRLPQRNTVAPVTWQVRQHQRDDWQDVVHAVVYRLQRDSGEVNSPAIAISRQAGRYWRLRIDSRAGGIGAGTPVLHLGWEPRELVFLARGAPPFTLAYGNRNAVAAQLPLASLLPGYQRGMERTLPVALAGDPHALGGHDAPAAGQEDQPPPDWKRWLLWGILLCAVGLLAFMALALLRKSARS